MNSIPAPRGSQVQRLALTVLAGLGLIGLTQCRAVSDRISGLALVAPRTLSMRSRCTHECNAEFEEALLAEAARYRAALRACGEDDSCRRNQQLVHERNLEELARERRRCKRACYNEGAGGTEA